MNHHFFFQLEFEEGYIYVSILENAFLPSKLEVNFRSWKKLMTGTRHEITEVQSPRHALLTKCWPAFPKSLVRFSREIFHGEMLQQRG